MRRIPLLTRRLVTLIPALVVLAIGVDPTGALVISQVVLSFGIPFALIPLLRLTNDRSIMEDLVNGPVVRWLLRVIVVLIVSLNLVLIYLTVAG